MKNEFIVSKIEASQDERTPFVYIVFNDTKTPGKENQQPPFGSMDTNFTSPEDLMKNLSKTFGRGMNLGESPTFKFSVREYEESGLRVGDKVTIDIKKLGNSGI